jgi:Type I phosphodiesterase / nucleotide pyrophosphatase
MKARTTAMTMPDESSIEEFRSRIRAIVEHEGTSSRRRPIVIFAIDGIPYDLAASSWRHARTERMRSVFPTTSSSAWLSSLTGLSVDDHGVPGVVFRVPDHAGATINVFEHRGPELPAAANIFSDAGAFGYASFSIAGDLSHLDCAWRDMLLAGSRPAPSHRFYTEDHGAPPPDPETTCRELRRAISACLQRTPPGSTGLVWCFVDVDQHIHRHGYDDHVLHLLSLLERTAIDLAQEAVVVAHSDHGLTPTRSDRRLEELIERLTARHGCALGGAGRARWIYPRSGTEQEIMDELARNLPRSVLVRRSVDLFRDGSLAHRRVGSIVLIADGEEFLCAPGYRFEHGSLTDRELYVPFSRWSW